MEVSGCEFDFIIEPPVICHVQGDLCRGASYSEPTSGMCEIVGLASNEMDATASYL